jgi:uncharacterized ferredoxin-like protein
LEHRLHQIAKNDGELDQVITVVRQEMERLAEMDEEVSEPLSYAYITRDGFKSL